MFYTFYDDFGEKMSLIKEGLHYLTTTDLVSLHSEISRVQIEHSHKNEIEKEDG